MSEDESVDRRVSRRAALKKIGVGTAIAWSAPVITTFGSRAFAAGTPAPLPLCNRGPCQPCFKPCPSNGGCACLDHGGDCVCISGFTSAFPCSADSECPSGSICVTCGGGSGMCGAPCR
jgi:hypothetical protein